MVFVCLSVTYLTYILFTVYSLLENARKYMFFREFTPHASEWWCTSKINRSKVKVTGNENVKFVLAHIVAHISSGKKWINLWHISLYKFHQWKWFIFVIFVCNFAERATCHCCVRSTAYLFQGHSSLSSNYNLFQCSCQTTSFEIVMIKSVSHSQKQSILLLRQ